MLKQRVITAVILLAVFLSALFLMPAWGFQALVLIMFGVAAWECSDLTGLANTLLRIGFTVVCLAAVLFGWQLLSHQNHLLSFFTLAALWWAVALLWVQGYPSSVIFWQSTIVRVVMGFLTLVPAGIAVLVIHGHANGEWIVLALLLLVAAADTGAYFSGRAFGKRKLAPKVSPGKSWEGVVGGLLLVSALAIAFSIWTDHQWYKALAIALPAAAVSVLGDLFESMLKRHRGVKDSGKILPGHGGVLDRIDGITAAAPIFTLGLLASGWSLA